MDTESKSGGSAGVKAAESRVLVRVSHEGSLDIDGEKVSVAVLEDGTEGFLRESLAVLIGMSVQRSVRFADLGAKFAGKYAESFSEKGCQVLRLSGQVGYFVSADAATALVNGMARALATDRVHAQQRHIHVRCLQVQCALVGIGLKAVIRDAVGYTQVRAAPVFEQLLRARGEPGRWKMTFDPDLIREFCRVYVQPFVPGRQPQFLAAVYREMYEAFAGVEMLDEIRARKRCKSNKHHQMLTDTAHNYLVSQLGRVKTLLRASQNASHFWALFYHEFQGKPVQTAIYWPN